MASNTDITVLVVGKTGAGKSTLINNLLEEEKEESGFTFVSNTESIGVRSTKWNNTTISIIDTPNLMSLGQVSSQERELMFNFVIFCIPVSPGSKFDENNPEIMKWLHNCYGVDIWKRCIIVFTFSNMAKDHACSSEFFTKPDSYIEYLKEYISCFDSSLKESLCVDYDIPVTLWKEGASNASEPRIIAIPAGYAPKDPVLPKHEVHNTEWRDAVLSEITMLAESNISLLPLKVYNSSGDSYYYNSALVGAAIGSAAIGGPIVIITGTAYAGGIAAGTAIGATAGVIYQYFKSTK